MDLTTLPLMAMKEIPQVREDAREIKALVKDSGKVVGYQLCDGEILPKDAALRLARQGGIKGVGIAENQGTEYLKTLPDNSEANNLSSLPSLSASELPQ